MKNHVNTAFLRNPEARNDSIRSDDDSVSTVSGWSGETVDAEEQAGEKKKKNKNNKKSLLKPMLKGKGGDYETLR